VRGAFGLAPTTCAWLHCSCNLLLLLLLQPTLLLSSAGHYVPGLALEIVRGNKRAAAAAAAQQTQQQTQQTQQQQPQAQQQAVSPGRGTLNLKGFLVGNAWTDAAIDNRGVRWWGEADVRLLHLAACTQLPCHSTPCTSRTPLTDAHLAPHKLHHHHRHRRHHAGALDFWYSHAMVGPESYAGITQHCDFHTIGPLMRGAQALALPHTHTAAAGAAAVAAAAKAAAAASANAQQQHVDAGWRQRSAAQHVARAASEGPTAAAAARALAKQQQPGSLVSRFWEALGLTTAAAAPSSPSRADASRQQSCEKW
jgi:hypothetical protein